MEEYLREYTSMIFLTSMKPVHAVVIWTMLEGIILKKDKSLVDEFLNITKFLYRVGYLNEEEIIKLNAFMCKCAGAKEETEEKESRRKQK